MSSILSNFWGDAILAELFAEKLWLALHTDVPPAGEVVGGGYARQPISFHAPAGRAAASAELALFAGVPMFGANNRPLEISWWGIWDAAHDGNLQVRNELAAPIRPRVPGIIEFAPGEIGIAL